MRNYQIAGGDSHGKNKKYVERFYKTRKPHLRYDICTEEIRAFKATIDVSPFEYLVLLFDYDFAKGYRCAEADKRKRAKNKAVKSA